jgi:transcriptional regulator with XRE-family HTH domain
LEPSKDYIDFGIRLSKLRTDKGYSQSDVSRMLNMPQSTYAGYEAGSRKASITVIKTLSHFYGITPDYLINGFNQSVATALPPVNAALHEKIDKLDEVDAGKAEGYIDSLLSSPKYEIAAQQNLA